MFEKYNVGVGISIDWSGWLNERASKTMRKQRRLCLLSENICEAGRAPSLIVTIHNKNGTRVPELLDWFLALRGQGVQYLNLHNLEVEKGMPNLTIPEERRFRLFQHL
jgi:hypothetical protein